MVMILSWKLTVGQPFTDLGDPLTVEEKDEVNSSFLHCEISVSDTFYLGDCNMK